MDAGHNISPRLRKQLVLELEVGVEGAELVDDLPSRVLFRKALPLDEYLPDASTLMRTEHLSRSRQPTVQGRSESAWGSRWISAVALKQPHVVHIMKTGTLWKLKTIRHATDVFQDTERPGIARAKFALGAWP